MLHYILCIYTYASVRWYIMLICLYFIRLYIMLMCTSRFLKEAGIILFLNKQDVLEEKIRRGGRIDNHFPLFSSYTLTDRKGSLLYLFKNELLITKLSLCFSRFHLHLLYFVILLLPFYLGIFNFYYFSNYLKHKTSVICVFSSFIVFLFL